jgi:type IV secretion system protein VirB8
VVNVVRPLENGSTSYDEAVNKYFTQWYVRWREGYIRERSQEYYYNVGITSAPAEQRRYLEQYDPKNSDSPLNVYKADGRSIITIKSTAFNSKDTATIHFTKEVDFGGKSRKVTQWMAIIHFTYTGARMSDQDREINPLGFQVLNYTVVDETPKSASAVALPAPAGAPGMTAAAIATPAQPSNPAAIAVPAIAAPTTPIPSARVNAVAAPVAAVPVPSNTASPSVAVDATKTSP